MEKEKNNGKKGFAPLKGVENPAYEYQLRVTRDRIAVIIGKKGEVKRKIEGLTHTSIDINSREGEVTISGSDGLELFNAREVLRAIGRGFNPEVAMLLIKQDYSLEIINMMDYTPNKNHLARLKGRVIGTGGKARRTLEELSGTYICVYGKTVSIIGETEDVIAARQALDTLLKGSTHSTVFRLLERRRRKMKLSGLAGRINDRSDENDESG